MKRAKRRTKIILITSALLFSILTFETWAQMSPDVYRKADDLVKLTTDKVYYGNVRPVWIGKTSSFLYENFTPDGTDYMIVDAEKLTKKKSIRPGKICSSAGNSHR